MCVTDALQSIFRQLFEGRDFELWVETYKGSYYVQNNECSSYVRFWYNLPKTNRGHGYQ